MKKKTSITLLLLFILGSVCSWAMVEPSEWEHKKNDPRQTEESIAQERSNSASRAPLIDNSTAERNNNSSHSILTSDQSSNEDLVNNNGDNKISELEHSLNRRKLQTAIDTEFQIPTNTTGNQYATIAAFSNGGFVVTWCDSSGNIYGQLYDSTKNTIGSAFQISTIGVTVGLGNMDDPNIRPPHVATVGGDKFIVTWSVNDGSSIYGKLYNASGSAIGSIFQITQNDMFVIAPAVTALSENRFAITWYGINYDGDFNIYGQFFDDTGLAIASIFQININQPDYWFPSIASLPGGGMVVIWGNSDACIYGQLYDATGAATGSNFQISSTANGHAPTATGLSQGGFVVTWTGVDGNIYGQLYDSAGAATGSNFQINTDTTGNNYRSTIAAGTDDYFVVTWSGGDGNVWGQLYSTTGATMGANFQINPELAGEDAYYPAVMASTDGKFVVVWHDNNGNIEGQEFSAFPLTSLPTANPTHAPSEPPTLPPTVAPTTLFPTILPTTIKPSLAPTLGPSEPPTFFPSVAPTIASPSAVPTIAPTTANPSFLPTTAPTTLVPTTLTPTTVIPSTPPTIPPTTIKPSLAPTTVSPSPAPSLVPTPAVTPAPSPRPSEPPTPPPSVALATASPSGPPTGAPTTLVPTTTTPSIAPTTLVPTTLVPTTAPTTAAPTAQPIMGRWSSLLGPGSAINSMALIDQDLFLGGGNSGASCFHLNQTSGELVGKYPLPWDQLKAATTFDNQLVLAGSWNDKQNLEVAYCDAVNQQLTCKYHVIPDFELDSMDFVPSCQQVLVMGHDLLNQTKTVAFNATGDPLWDNDWDHPSMNNVRYTAIGSTPKFVAGAIGGHGEGVTDSKNNIISSWKPAFGQPLYMSALTVDGKDIINKEELVRSTTFEPTSLDQFIGGGIDLDDSRGLQPYIARLKAVLLNTVPCAMRFLGGNGQIKDMTFFNNWLYAIVDSTGFAPNIHQSQLSIFQINPATCGLFNQLRLSGPGDVSCSKLTTTATGFDIACHLNSTEALALSLNGNLSSYDLPPGFQSQITSDWQADPLAMRSARLQKVVTSTDNENFISGSFSSALERFTQQSPSQYQRTYISPTRGPTVTPTSNKPSGGPSPKPTGAPTFRPSIAKTLKPTATPTTALPTTPKPSRAASEYNNSQPVVVNTPEPSEPPTPAPTEALSAPPSHEPSEPPTPAPSESPSAPPTVAPSPAPTLDPSPAPSKVQVITDSPTNQNNLSSRRPVGLPTIFPAYRSDDSFTITPTGAPTEKAIIPIGEEIFSGKRGSVIGSAVGGASGLGLLLWACVKVRSYLRASKKESDPKIKALVEKHTVTYTSWTADNSDNLADSLMDHIENDPASSSSSDVPISAYVPSRTPSPTKETWSGKLSELGSAARSGAFSPNKLSLTKSNFHSSEYLDLEKGVLNPAQPAQAGDALIYNPADYYYWNPQYHAYDNDPRIGDSKYGDNDLEAHEHWGHYYEPINTDHNYDHQNFDSNDPSNRQAPSSSQQY